VNGNEIGTSFKKLRKFAQPKTFRKRAKYMGLPFQKKDFLTHRPHFSLSFITLDRKNEKGLTPGVENLS
jgi:hypothetical protein